MIFSAIYCTSKYTCLTLSLRHKNQVLKTLLSTEWMKLIYLLYNLSIVILATCPCIWIKFVATQWLPKMNLSFDLY